MQLTDCESSHRDGCPRCADRDDRQRLSPVSQAAIPYYRAASMQGGLIHERNVCPSVRPSVCQTLELCDKTKETAHILIPHERTII